MTIINWDGRYLAADRCTTISLPDKTEDGACPDCGSKANHRVGDECKIRLAPKDRLFNDERIIAVASAGSARVTDAAEEYLFRKDRTVDDMNDLIGLLGTGAPHWDCVNQTILLTDKNLWMINMTKTRSTLKSNNSPTFVYSIGYMRHEMMFVMGTTDVHAPGAVLWGLNWNNDLRGPIDFIDTHSLDLGIQQVTVTPELIDNWLSGVKLNLSQIKEHVFGKSEE